MILLKAGNVELMEENQDDVDNYDIGHFDESSDQLTEYQLYDLINKLWKPGKTFQYPVTIESGKNRKFNPNWFDLYPWLDYSKYLDGIFCIPCAFFEKKSGHADDKLTKLFKEPLTYWTSVSGRLKGRIALRSCSFSNNEWKEILYQLTSLPILFENKGLRVTE